MATFGNDLVPLVECCHGVGQGDVKLLHEAEVTGSHLPAVGWSLADNRPAPRKRYILVLQLPEIAREGDSVGKLLVIEGLLVAGEQLLEGVGSESIYVIIYILSSYLAENKTEE